ncbi:MalY/PatB family protein [Lactococcus sp. LG606]|uniref:MalY/PatB family protein n=1 Tax=Lactococcus sp. LG606 TaxID=2816912 RepID=UPI001A9061C5|nr:MalY/PatB family protein [Lactococcus sp. LG606]QSR13020.1 pyridoxal phosphate-dependent aminotransferase [Lactococcus sp. LG606]
MTEFDKIIERKGTFCTQWDFVEDRFGQKDLLPFTISDTDFAIPETVNQALQKRIQHPIYGYTRWNHKHFKSAVSAWYQKQFDFAIEEDWILYSPSVIYSLSQLIEIKSQPQEGVVVQTPAYDAFFKTITANNRLCVENPLIFNEGKYTIDFIDLEEKLAHPNNKILLFCSPHNPTGRVWTSEELQQVVLLCQKYDVFLISDEIHMDVLRKDKQHHPILQYGTENIALLTSASKTFNFPGLIFSYLLVPNANLREEFCQHLKEKDGLSSCSILGMEATVAAYRTSDIWLKELNSYLDDTVDFTRAFLKEYLPKIKLIESEATYLLWLDVSEQGVPMDKLQQALINIGKVAIMDGEVYGQEGRNFLRLNIGCSRSKVKDGLERLLKSIQAL